MTNNWDPAKYPIPADKELVVQYDPDTDTLVLGNGTPASNGSTVARGLMVFYDDDDAPHMVTLENARSVLLALLQETRGAQCRPVSSSPQFSPSSQLCHTQPEPISPCSEDS